MAESTVTEKRTTRHTGNGDSTVRDSDVAVFDVVDVVEPSRPMDRVRWGAVLAGLVTALSTLVLLSVLGLAIGLTTFETGDQLSNFGMGAGIWGAISTIVAFVLGGWVAARSAAVRGRSNALLNGAMVWAVAIPLIMYLLGSGVGSMMNMATDAAAASATALTEAAPADTNAAANAVQEQAQQVDPATVNDAAQNAGEAAWGTLVALLLGLAAAVGGGLMGERKQPEMVRTA
jgi:hypothetical protein